MSGGSRSGKAMELAPEIRARMKAEGGKRSGSVRANTPTPFVFTAATRFQAFLVFLSITAVAGCPPGVRPQTYTLRACRSATNGKRNAASAGLALPLRKYRPDWKSVAGAPSLNRNQV